MNRSELITQLHEQAGITTVDATAAVNGTFDIILEALKNGDTVDLKGIGSFSTKRTEARTARNPFNGETVEVEAKTVPKFKFSNTFKAAVNVPPKKKGGRNRL